MRQPVTRSFRSRRWRSHPEGMLYEGEEEISMLVVLGLVPIFIVIAIIWPIVAIAKQQQAQSGYTFTACVAAWYAQIMVMVGIVVFTIGIGYLFKSLIGYLN